MSDEIDMDALFSLEDPLPPPAIPTAPSASALDFLSQIHRRKSDSLKAIVAESGMPTLRNAAPNAVAAAFMIVQHADYDPELQLQCHSLMVSAAKKGEMPLGFVAFLTDKILTNNGKHQRFGTQIREVSNGSFVPKSLEDPDNVDVLREQVGLGENLSDYFQRVNDGDLLLYRPLLGEYAHELEHTKETKVIPFPQKP